MDLFKTLLFIYEVSKNEKLKKEIAYVMDMLESDNTTCPAFFTRMNIILNEVIKN